MTLDYYYGDQAEQFSFYRIPKVLFTDSRFKDISAEAKILYGLLLDRMSLSAKNGWLDQEGRVYIVYTVEDIMDALSCASQKAMKLLNELDEKCGLIERKRQGLGKPNLIYVKNFVATPESKFKNGENQNSGLLKIKAQEFPKSKGSNTEKNNTDFNDTESFPFTSFRDGQKREPKGNDTMPVIAPFWSFLSIVKPCTRHGIPQALNNAINKVPFVLHWPYPSDKTFEAGILSSTLYPNSISSRTKR